MANEYIYAKDMGRAVDLAVSVQMPAKSIFNIGNGVVTPFEEVVGAVRRLFPALEFEIEPGAPPKSKAAPLSISAAKHHLGWSPAFDIAAGFDDYLAEMRLARGV
jgi:nucleoside-diphosphate-sugar epimerase